MTENNSTTLVEYGIQNEASDIRCHVAPGTHSIFVFKTSAARDALKKHTYRTGSATQRGTVRITGLGYLVPPDEIPDIRKIAWKTYPWWDIFHPDDDTSAKGKKAVWVATELLRMGRFPLWTVTEESEVKEVQISGTDILLNGTWRIQVKCDYWAGKSESGEGTGNIFLQIKERNPFKKT